MIQNEFEIILHQNDYIHSFEHVNMSNDWELHKMILSLIVKREFKIFWSVFSPNAEKYGPELQ